MSDPADLSKLLSSYHNIDSLLPLFCKSPETLSDADKTRLLRVIVSFLAVVMKVDLKLTI